MVVLQIGWTMLQAAEAASPEGRPRALFLIDTSRSMAGHKLDIAEAVVSRVRAGLDGELRAGDVFNVWTFGQTLATNRYSPFAWSPMSETARHPLSEALLEQPFGGEARLDAALKAAVDLAAASDSLTVVLLTDGTASVAGTPFDSQINSAYRKIKNREDTASALVMTTFLARDRQMLAWSVAPFLAPSMTADPVAPLPAVRSGSPRLMPPQRGAGPRPAASLRMPAPPTASVREHAADRWIVSGASGSPIANPDAKPLRGELPIPKATHVQAATNPPSQKTAATAAPAVVATIPQQADERQPVAPELPAQEQERATEVDEPAAHPAPDQPDPPPTASANATNGPLPLTPALPAESDPPMIEAPREQESAAPPPRASKVQAPTKPVAAPPSPAPADALAPVRHEPILTSHSPAPADAAAQTRDIPQVAAATLQAPGGSPRMLLWCGAGLVILAGGALLYFGRQAKPGDQTSLISKSLDAPK